MNGRMETGHGALSPTVERMEPTELARWKRRLADVPDIRLSKVNRIRRAIRLNAYDETALLERVLPALEFDLAATSWNGDSGD